MPEAFVLRCLQAPFIRFVIDSKSCTVGRSSGCNFVVNHPSVSRRHARCAVDRDGLTVFDLASRNGTFVDNRRVEKSRVARNQTVRLGSVSFVVDAEERRLSPESEQETDVDQGDWRALTDASEATGLLSAGQRRVFDLLLSGKKEKSIAKTLRLSPHTVHTHVRSIFQIFAVHSRLELLARFVARPPE